MIATTKVTRLFGILLNDLIVSTNTSRQHQTVFLIKQKMGDEVYSNIIYKSLDAVLRTLQQENFQHLDGVRQTLTKYNKFLEETTNPCGVKKYPFIVLEGLDGCGKTTLTKRVAEKLNAKLMVTPPPCISDIRKLFDNPEYKDVRGAFYSLGNYIASKQIEIILQTQPVVLDRYWHSTAAYAIAQANADYPEKYKIPPASHELYQWPKDLLKPDLIIYLYVNESNRLKRMKNRTFFTPQEVLLQKKEFRDSVENVYSMIRPSMTQVSSNDTKYAVEASILRLISPLMPKE